MKAMRYSVAKMLRIVLSMVALGGIAGCATVAPPSASALSVTVSAGTILSMRAAGSFAVDSPVRGALLVSGTGRDETDQPLVEFIVHADDGATLSIVQPNDAGFRAADRVIIERGDQTRLARPG
jgi:outer membrane lipoprotein SlyB